MAESNRQKYHDFFLMAGLLQAYYWMDESLQNHLRAEDFADLSRTQSMILTSIADGVTRPAELARRLGVSRQAVQQILADLAQRGLVDLLPDPADARAKIVTYHARGREARKATFRALGRINRILEERIGRGALDELRRVLLDVEWGEPIEAPRKSATQLARRAKAGLEAPVARAVRPLRVARRRRSASA